jgi:hypothetical protein
LLGSKWKNIEAKTKEGSGKYSTIRRLWFLNKYA